MFKKIILFVLFAAVCVSGVFAQLSFPKGNTLNLYTHNTPLYIETEILFHTGIYKITDYDFYRVSDSLDTRWIVSSCMNGNCIDSLPKSGTFIPDFGYNDTTGFIRFHIESNDSTGRSKIVYEVANRKNMLDAATLTFIITYKNNTGIEDVKLNNTTNIYPNPAKEMLNIYHVSDRSKNTEISIYDIQGKMVHHSKALSDITIINLRQSEITSGIYFVKISEGDKSTFSKLCVY